jgi:hypothetical protein
MSKKYLPGSSLHRRTVVKTLALGAVAAMGLPARQSRSADTAAKVDIHDPAAVKLGYVENASQVDPKRFTGFIPGSTCENCVQLQGKPGNDYRPCSLFSGKLVAVSGWCSGWTPEM